MRLMSMAVTAALSLFAMPLAASAQDCGDAETPCPVDGGTYHMAMPAAEDAKGIVVHLHGAGAQSRGLLNSGLDVPVLLAGFSRGGSMVWDIACQVPDFASAYAPLAGAFWDDLPEGCAAPVKLFHTHGWNDRTVPLEGRSFRDGAVVQGDVWASLKILRETNGCDARQPERNSFDGELWFRHWTDCRDGQIQLMLHKGGHGAPAGWANRMLDWFEAGLS